MKTLTVSNASAGSGKTFTLAAYYVACLMRERSDGAYRSILAVTFTNKATEEMKDRILSYLYALSNGKDEKAFIGKVQAILRSWHITLSEDELRDRAGHFFSDMLEHYDDVRVTTIDSFLQLLLSGLAQTIGLSSSYAIEIGQERIIREAVDQIISTHIDEQEGLAEAISSFLTEQMDETSRWDIRADLRKLAEDLFKEAVLEQGDRLSFDKQRILAFRKAVRWENSPEYKSLSEAYEPLNSRRDEVAAMTGGKNYISFLNRVEKMLHNRIPDKFSLGKTDLERLSKPAFRSTLTSLLSSLHEAVDRVKSSFLDRYYTTEHLNQLILLGYLRNRIKTSLIDSNSALLAETAAKLCQALRPGDADFILERAGIRFKHILLDEFQDTSTLQWLNFLKLIEEVLASGGTTLIVGDTKQSIYRWRNGNRHIMEGLKPDHPTLGHFITEQPLRTNYRSRREIVRFNLDFFASLSTPLNSPPETGGVALAPREWIITPLHSEADRPSLSRENPYAEGYTSSNLSDYYVSGSHEGGYVQFRAYPYANAKERASVREAILDHMFKQIDSLIRAGVRPSDCLILVRTKAEGQAVLDRFHHSYTPFPSGEGRGEAFSLVTADSFTLDRSRAVNIAICALKFLLRRDSVSEAYIRFAMPGFDTSVLRSIKPNLPLTEMLEEVLRLLSLPSSTSEQPAPNSEESNVFTPSLLHSFTPNSSPLGGGREGSSPFPSGEGRGEALSLNALQDKVRNYVATNGSDPEAFLSYWDEVMHIETIGAVDAEAVRLMTIHKSKGLEAKNVFIPFCTWELISTSHRSPLWCTPAASPRPSPKGKGERGGRKEGDPEGVSLVPVTNSDDLEATSYAPVYAHECEDERIDNLNLLYVALTRAAERLFVYADLHSKADRPSPSREKSDAPTNVGALLLRHLGLTLDAPYAEYISGTLSVPSQKQDSENKAASHPFSFSTATPVPATLHHMGAHIEFKQSQDSRLYLSSPFPSGEGRGEALPPRVFGTICHDILARAERLDDIPRIIDAFTRQGIIPNEAVRGEVSETLDRIRTSPQMCDWFSGSWRILRETTILSPSPFPSGEGRGEALESRPDRVMLRGNTAIVLDYKFGQLNEWAYTEQVRHYMTLFRDLGYTDVHGYLWLSETSSLLQIT